MTCKHLSNWRERELLPHTVDRLAREQPSAPYGLWPVAQASYDAGFRTIDYGQLANIVNGLAWWIEEHLGRSEVSGQQVLTYLGPNDVRLTALVLASIKAGYGLFLTSPRNSPAAHQALFAALKCRTLVTTDPIPPPAKAILEAVTPRPAQLSIPTVDELLAKQHPVFVYDKSFESGRLDPLFIIHSSGSTGMPKPKVWTQESGARHQACSMADHATQPGAASIEELLWGKRVLSTLPSFHGAGLAMYLFWAITFRAVPIAPAAVGIVTAQGLLEALEQTPAEVAFLVPSVVVELAQNPSLLARCAKHLKVILYAGGDLPQALGDRVAASIPLRCWWGATECGLPQQLKPLGLGPQDWRYIRYHPCVGAAFEEVANGSYELVMRRSKDLEQYQVPFSIRGQEDLDEYRTNDLFQPHPTVEDAWCWRGRADDVIVFLNGEKTNPLTMEQHIVASNPEISSALVIGTKRFQAALLIEMPPSVGSLSTMQEAEIIERLWPSVQEANETAPAHARVEKPLILILPADRPLIRAGKGTIQRAASIKQYAAEIERLYDNADVIDDEVAHDFDQINIAAPTDLSDEEHIRRFINVSVNNLTGGLTAKSQIKSSRQDEDVIETFFDRGMDSLMALQLLRALRRGLQRPDLGLSTIYSNPTISQLQAALLPSADSTGSNEDDTSIMKSLLATYSEFIHQIRRPTTLPAEQQAPGGPTTAVLTGSTGTIGTYVLQALLDHPGIEHVICLNRGRDGGRKAQESRLAVAGCKMDPDLLDRRVTFLRADLSKPSLGMAQSVYEDLRTRVGLVIHSAWPVNFNLSLLAFQPQLAGLCNLIRLAAEASRPARFVFVSSVGAVGGLAAKGAPVPEEVFTSFDTPYANGYSRSKFLSELLCNLAAENLGVATTIIRLGQIAGAVRRPGEWNRTEWIPNLVIGSRAIGCLPDSIGSFSAIDWVPVDILADVLVELVMSKAAVSNSGHEQKGAHVFHVRNPRITTWQSLLPAIVQSPPRQGDDMEPGPARAPEVVGSNTWLTRLSEHEREVDGSGQSPRENLQGALKLLDFYRGILRDRGEAGVRQQAGPMEITHSLAESATLRDMKAVNPDWMTKWVREWGCS